MFNSFLIGFLSAVPLFTYFLHLLLKDDRKLYKTVWGSWSVGDAGLSACEKKDTLRSPEEGTDELLPTATTTAKSTLEGTKGKAWSEETSSENESEYNGHETLGKWIGNNKSQIEIQRESRDCQTDECLVENVQHSDESNWRSNLQRQMSQVTYSTDAIRRIQQQQLNNQFGYLNEKDLKSPLIICVEATSSNISGYLLNLRENVCKFYVYGIDKLPWKVETPTGDRDLTEFKMKNMIFALLLWEQEIMRSKKYSIYVNCAAVNHLDYGCGKLASDFMEHFAFCENVIRVNSNAQLSRYRDTALFARLIQPASELGHKNLLRFRNFIKNSYGISHFEGSHSFFAEYSEAARDDGYFERSFRHNFFLGVANKNAEKWCISCPKCKVQFAKTLDFKLELSSDSDSNKGDGDLWPYPLTDDIW